MDAYLEGKSPEETFGRYLRQQRSLRNIHLEEIAKISKLPLYHLEALENGKWDVFIAPIYLIGAVRSYARILGMVEEDLILHLYEVVPHLNKERKLSPSPSHSPRKKGLWLTLLGIMILGFLIIFVKLL